MKLWTNIRVIILIAFFVLAIAAINPRPWQDGVTIRNVEKGSAAFAAGIVPSEAKISPVLRERITRINGVDITNESDYAAVTETFLPNMTVRVDTNKKSYTLQTEPLIRVDTLDEMETVNVTSEIFDNETNVFTNSTTEVTRNKTIETVIGTAPLGFTVYNAPKTNIRLGLDLSGGARVLMEPEHAVTQQEMDTIIETITQRLNVFGISDIIVRPVSDLSGKQFILVEVAGATEKDVRDLVQQQGKFEAKIANISTFKGGSDITYVCRSAECSGIAQQGCAERAGGGDKTWSCQFQFSVTVTPAAARRQADLTSNLSIITKEDGQQYLDKSIDLYLDDKLVESLLIGASLRGNSQTTFAISGGGSGATETQAAQDALHNMKQLQTILITGSLPVQLHVVKTDSITAELGDEFISNALFVALLAFITVTVVMAVRYRRPRIAIPVMITLISEIVIILGVASLVGWSIDLAAIAGILIAIGTGVDAQIVIADEVMHRKEIGESQTSDWKDKMKRAFFIIFTSYFTALASLIPLWWAGAGLVRGFAITSIIGITIGVLITRPAFSVIMEKLEKKDDE